MYLFTYLKYKPSIKYIFVSGIRLQNFLCSKMLEL